MKPPAAMTVPAAIWYFCKLVAESLRYQPPTSIAALVVLRSSIQSPPAAVLLERISLMATEPAARPGSAAPGRPWKVLPGRQLSLRFRFGRPAGLAFTSEYPPPSV